MRTAVEVELSKRVCVIGRHPDCDITLDDSRISARHVLVEPLDSRTWRVADLGTRNGTYHGSNRVEQLQISSTTRLRLGHPDRGVVIDLLAPRQAGAPTDVAPSPGPAGVVLEDVVIRRGGAELLHGVSAALPAGKLTAIIGPSGAGKSTLLAAITGAVPLAGGRVLLGGSDLADLNAGVLSSMVGVVPQDDVLHTSLPLRTSLRISARLLLPRATGRRERYVAVDRVIDILGLAERAGVRIDRLSGGQRKRANAAAALLTQPRLLVLDEPTSGLDPHLERAYMRDLKRLAGDGSTVVVATHSSAAVEAADHVVAVTAGRIAYEGTPGGLPGHFRARGIGTVFEQIGGDDAVGWADRWEQDQRSGDTRRLALPPPAVAPGSRRHHFLPLLWRSLRLLTADRASLILLLLQAPLLGLLARLFPDGGGFDESTAPNADIRPVLLVLVLAATWLGTFAGIRQVVDERAVLDRELAAGVSPGGYVFARGSLLAGLVVVQVLGLVVAALAGRDLPTGRLSSRPGLELFITLVLTGLAAAGVGLLVSALARTSAGAAALAPLVVVPQLLLCGALMRVDDTMGLDIASRLVSARAGFSAVASSTDLVLLEGGGDAPTAWRADARTWLLDVLELGALAVVALLLLRWVLHRRATRQR